MRVKKVIYGSVRVLRVLADALVALVFPKVCAACGSSLLSGERSVCLRCLMGLPRPYVRAGNSGVILRGRLEPYINLVGVAALYTFERGGDVQRLVHQLKYNGRKDVGLELGEELGRIVMAQHDFDDVDVIVPVPLHMERLKRRGYNQSEEVAMGVNRVTGWEVDTESVMRTVNNSTQTKKSKTERWLNSQGIFKVEHGERLRGRHVLVVDDIITTGSTVTSMCHEIQKVGGVRVSVACLACTCS